jgi:putative endonuclease
VVQHEPQHQRTGDTQLTCFVYIIGATTPRGFTTYVGWTLDLDRRLSEHNAGTGAKSTRGRCWQLIYAEKLETRVAAMSREWHLKRDRRLRRQLNPVAAVDNDCQPVQLSQRFNKGPTQ